MITGVNHITFAVKDLKQSFDFYTGLLGLKPVATWEGGAYLTAGNTWIALNRDNTVSGPAQQSYSHIAFTCTRDIFPTLKKALLEYGCREWAQNESEGESFYFLDPDGHQLEIHDGDLMSRLNAVKKDPTTEFTYYT